MADIITSQSCFIIGGPSKFDFMSSLFTDGKQPSVTFTLKGVNVINPEDWEKSKKFEVCVESIRRLGSDSFEFVCKRNLTSATADFMTISGTYSTSKRVGNVSLQTWRHELRE